MSGTKASQGTPRAEQEPLSEEIEKAVREACIMPSMLRFQEDHSPACLSCDRIRDLARKVQALTLERAAKVAEGVCGCALVPNAASAEQACAQTRALAASGIREGKN